MEKVYRLHFSAWLFTLTAAVVTATTKQPPMITKFLPKDLVKPNDVTTRTTSFKLPCEASGTNLTWTWKHNNREISLGKSDSESLREDGTLIRQNLSSKHGGTYQCFVKDEETGVEVFSRKLKVAVTVAGDFIDKKDLVEKVDLGQSFRFRCPQHTAAFGAIYYWIQNKWGTHFSRNERRGISPDGTLFITYVTQEDINDIDESQGIKCRMTAGNDFLNSGTLKLEKNNPEQSDPSNNILPTWAEAPAAEVIAIEGKTKTLYCMAYGKPAPNITWKKNGRQIVSGQNSFEIPSHYYGRRLTIANVNRTIHQDVYTCEASNSLSNVQPLIRTINLVVKVPPRWTKGLPPKKGDVIIGRNETIGCTVMADPEAAITWFKNGQPLQSSRLNSDHLILDGSKLHLRDVNLTDDGVYQCVAENKYGMLVSATWVHVKAWKPSFADRQFGLFPLLHGYEGTLKCKPSAEPQPTFQWYRNGALVSYGENSRYTLQKDGTLVIKKVDKDKDSANYTCKAQNMMGQDLATTVPTVLVLPSFVTKPRNQTVIEKQNAIFYCNATGNPTPRTTWLKDGTTVGTGNTLRFDSTWRYQAGKYWCEANNGLNVTIKTSTDLNVQFLPYFTRRPTDHSVMEGHEAMFHCTASGNPSPIMTWLKDGKIVDTGETLKFLAFKNHTGKYWCSADNGLGSPINTSADLNVQFQPLLIAKPRDQRVIENTTVTFHCNATGNPIPKITWTKDGLNVATGNKLTFVALRSHGGRYWCSADNGLSAGVKANAYLRVLSLPLPPTNVKVSDCKDWTAKLSWAPDPSQNDSITQYLIEQESSEDPAVFLTLFTVTNSNTTSLIKLSKGSVPRFRMKAVNMVGASRPSLIVETSCKGSETKVGARQHQETPIYYTAWFLTVLALVSYAILFALLLVLYRKYKGKGVKYNVSKREKKRGCRDEVSQPEEKIDEEEMNSLVVDTENTPPEDKPQESNPRPRPTSIYSLFEVQFGEDASFTEEYGDQDEMFQHIQGTFV